MKPIEFEGVNVVYGKDQPEYQPLPANRASNGTIITCWELSPEEKEEILKTGKLWFSQLTFNKPMQPILPSAYELEHNEATGGITYKNLPECEHDLNDGICSKCNLVIEPKTDPE